jgi:hypothetical protein
MDIGLGAITRNTPPYSVYILQIDDFERVNRTDSDEIGEMSSKNVPSGCSASQNWR